MKLPRIASVLALLPLLVASVFAPTVQAASGPGGPRTTAAAPFDFAAVVPAPADLGPAFVNSGGQFHPPIYYVATGAASAEQLASEGFVGGYGCDLSVLDPKNPLRELQHLRVALTLFQSDVSAREYVTHLTAPNGYAAVASTLSVGDDLTVLKGSGTANGRAFTSRIVHYRSGSLAIALTITNYGAGSPNGLPVSDAGLTTFATVVNARLAKVRQGALGGLEPMILRLGDAKQVYLSAYEAYIELDGVFTPRYGVTQAETRQIESVSKGMRDDYEATQAVGTVDAQHALFTNLYRFDNEADATAFMTAVRAALLSNSGFTSIAERRGAARFGDESFALTYVAPGQKGGPAISGQRLFARVGAMVVSLGLEDVTAPPASVVETLMPKQLACVAAGSCPDTIPLPA